MATKQWIYRIRPTRPDMLETGPTPEEEAPINSHFEYLKELTEKGIVLLAGRTMNTDESSFGIVIYLADNDAAACAIFHRDPAVKAGVFTGAFFPFSVALISGAWQKKAKSF